MSEPASGIEVLPVGTRLEPWSLCRWTVRLPAIAARLGLPLHHWVEDGLGSASGVCCRLPDGLMMCIYELEHAIARMGDRGPAVEVDLYQLHARGIEACMQSVCAAFGVERDQIDWVIPELPDIGRGAEPARA